MAGGPVIRSDQVLERFSRAAPTYATDALLQRAMAWRLAQLSRRCAIPRGLWADLGSGTGHLAAALEASHPGQEVMRIDGSAAMLRSHPSGVQILRHDLSSGLPDLPVPPQLLASSFVLHWLPDPAQQLRTWVDALADQGWLALAVPIDGSFPQWQQAAQKANQNCTALTMPVRDQLMAALPDGVVQLEQCLSFTQHAANPLKLLRPMSNVGASVTNAGQLSPGQWKAVFRAWPQSDQSPRFALTWKMLILMVKR